MFYMDSMFVGANFKKCVSSNQELGVPPERVGMTVSRPVNEGQLPRFKRPKLPFRIVRRLGQSRTGLGSVNVRRLSWLGCYNGTFRIV